MINHWIVAPVLIPLTAAILLLFAGRAGIGLQRAIGLVATVAAAASALLLLPQVAGGSVLGYSLGDWPAPFGIILVADRLSVLLLLLTGAVALPALLAACGGTDRAARHFHALFQFQLVGIHGAFLTGDLFNLFVFFEILLIASYTLLLYGGQLERVRAGVHFVLLNLMGSAVFLLGIGTLYGLTGTLNMAHLAQQVAALGPGDVNLARSAALLLLVVFGLKSALLPLGFWLPHTYGAAAGPVAVLFAIMTKVGVYSILRTATLIFGPEAGLLSGALWPVLGALAVVTLLIAAWGALGATRMRGLQGQLLVASVGTMLAAMAMATPAAVGAAIYYMLHSTLAIAALYLVGWLWTRGRGELDDRLLPGPKPRHWGSLGALFGLVAVAVAGLPPLSGFVGKLLMLDATAGSMAGYIFWAAVLGGGVLMLVALARALSVLVWQADGEAPAASAPAPAQWLALGLLVVGIIGLTVAAGPVHDFAAATAGQLLTPSGYVSGVLGP